jgi:hypothetical protein
MREGETRQAGKAAGGSSMIFPSDAEIREYCAYYIRAMKIFKEKFKIENGREPSEFELQDFSKMGIIPFGILKQQNGNSNFQTPQISPQKLVQQAQKIPQQSEQKNKPELVMDIVKNYPELSIEGDKIIMKHIIKPTEVFYKLKEDLKKRGWEYIAPRQVSADKWEPGHFEFKEGAKA